MIIFCYSMMCLIFGTTFLVIKLGIDGGLPPFFSAGLRFVLAGMILYLWMVGRGKVKIALLFRKEMVLTGLGLTFGTFSTLYWAEQYVSSGIAAVLSATGPILILLLQSRFLHQKMTLKALVGCVIGFVGVAILLFPQISIESNHHWIIACLCVLLGEISYSIGAVYSKRVIQQFVGTSPIALNAAQMIYGGLFLLFLSALREPVHVDMILKGSSIGSLLYLTIIGSMMGHSLFYWLVAKTNPIFPATWLYISPLIALVLGELLYNETVSRLAIVGSFTIIIGIVLVNMDAWKKGVEKTPSRVVKTDLENRTLKA